MVPNAYPIYIMYMVPLLRAQFRLMALVAFIYIYIYIYGPMYISRIKPYCPTLACAIEADGHCIYTYGLVTIPHIHDPYTYMVPLLRAPLRQLAFVTYTSVCIYGPIFTPHVYLIHIYMWSQSSVRNLRRVALVAYIYTWWVFARTRTVCECVFVCARVHMYVCVRVCVCLRLCLYLCVCLCLRVHLYVCRVFYIKKA